MGEVFKSEGLTPRQVRKSEKLTQELKALSQDLDKEKSIVMDHINNPVLSSPDTKVASDEEWQAIEHEQAAIHSKYAQDIQKHIPRVEAKIRKHYIKNEAAYQTEAVKSIESERGPGATSFGGDNPALVDQPSDPSHSS